MSREHTLEVGAEVTTLVDLGAFGHPHGVMPVANVDAGTTARYAGEHTIGEGWYMLEVDVDGETLHVPAHWRHFEART